MSFFEPLPPQQQIQGPYGPTWVPPAWDRPSEGVVPGILPLSKVLASGEHGALVLESLGVYPNGLVLKVVIMRNPRQPMEPGLHDHFGHPERWPRIGVEFADGRRAG